MIPITVQSGSRSDGTVGSGSSVLGFIGWSWILSWFWSVVFNSAGRGVALSHVTRILIRYLVTLDLTLSDLQLKFGSDSTFYLDFISWTAWYPTRHPKRLGWIQDVQGSWIVFRTIIWVLLFSIWDFPSNLGILTLVQPVLIWFGDCQSWLGTCLQTWSGTWPWICMLWHDLGLDLICLCHFATWPRSFLI